MKYAAVVSRRCLRSVPGVFLVIVGSSLLPMRALAQQACFAPPNINLSCQISIKYTVSGGNPTWSLPAGLKSVWLWAASSTSAGSILTWNRSDGDKSFQMKFPSGACFQGGSSIYSAPANGSGNASTPPASVIQDTWSTQDCSYQMFVNGTQYDPHVIIIGPPPNQQYCKKLSGEAQKLCIRYFKEVKEKK
jgi:hypothetical protein